MRWATWGGGGKSQPPREEGSFFQPRRLQTPAPCGKSSMPTGHPIAKCRVKNCLVFNHLLNLSRYFPRVAHVLTAQEREQVERGMQDGVRSGTWGKNREQTQRVIQVGVRSGTWGRESLTRRK